MKRLRRQPIRPRWWRAGRLAAALVAGALVWGPVAADAAPSGTAITGVYEVAGCAAAICGAGDVQLASGSITRGGLQIDVASDDNLGLGSVRLEAIGGGETAWLCIHLWNPGGAKHFAAAAAWASAAWPFPGTVSGCTEAVSHKNGEPTLNGSYRMRLVAQESGTGKQVVSPEFEVRLANPARPPVWKGPATTSGSTITFRWYRSVEPDVVEYRIIRTDAAGKSIAIPVDAAAPSKTRGCAPEKDSAFRCTDTPQPGRFVYGLRAYRPTPGQNASCLTRAQACVASESAATQTVVVSAGLTKPAGGGAGSSPRAGSTPHPSVSVLSATFAPGGAPAESTDVAAPRATAGTDRGVPIALATVALLALVAVHGDRARRATASGLGRSRS